MGHSWAHLPGLGFVLVALLGSLVGLAEWNGLLEWQRSVAPGAPRMVPAVGTATLALSLSLALALLRRAPSLSLALALLSGGIGAAQLLQWLFGLPPSWEKVLHHSTILSVLLSKAPIASPAVLSLLLGAMALPLCQSPLGKRRRLSRHMSILGLLIGLTGLIGALYRVPPLRTEGPFAQMAPLTALVFTALFSGLLSAHPSRRVLALLRGTSPGTLMARRLLPVILVVPLVLGWGLVEAVSDNILAVGTAAATLVVVLTSALAGLLLRAAWLVDRSAVAQRRAERAFRTSEERLRLIFDSATGYAIFTTDLNGRVIHWNSGAQRLLGYSEADILGRPSELLFTEDDRKSGLPSTERQQALEQGRARSDRWHQKADGSRFWSSGLVMPLMDGERPIGFLKILRDQTERRMDEERLALLVAELNHRVKNTLATVQSIALQTLRHSASPQAFEQAFSARLMALSAAHDLLTQHHWVSVSLRDLLATILAPYTQEGGEGRVWFSGPEIALTAKQAVSLNLAFHELATNAAKYGALSVPVGQVEVAWQRDDGWLEIRWRETGGPPVREPARRGFGSRLLERSLAYDLRGPVTLEFLPGGVHCRISLPLGQVPAARAHGEARRPPEAH